MKTLLRIGGALRPQTLVAVVLTAALFGGYALTRAENHQSGVIDACVSASGLLRIVASAEECRPSETPLQWQQAGARGEPGPAGPAGEGGSIESLSDLAGISCLVGDDEGTVSLTVDNDGDVAIRCVLPPPGPAVALAISPPSWTATVPNQQQSFVVRNNGELAAQGLVLNIAGTGASEFTMLGSSCTGQVLQPDASCSVTIGASNVQGSTAQLAVTPSNGGGALAALAVGTVALAIEPGSAQFSLGGEVPFVVRNQGTFLAQNVSVGLTGAVGPNAFTIVQNNCPSAMPAGTNCQVRVRLSASADPGVTAELRVLASNGATAVANLSGPSFCSAFPTTVDNGVVSCDEEARSVTLVCDPGWIDANGQLEDGCETALVVELTISPPTWTATAPHTQQVFQVRNDGTLDAQDVLVDLEGAGADSFQIVFINCPAVLSSGGVCQVTVAATATATQGAVAQLSVTASNGAAATANLFTGLVSLTINPTGATFSFGSSRTFEVRNNGTFLAQGLNAAIVPPGAYAITDNTCGPTLPATASCFITVQHIALSGSAELRVTAAATGTTVSAQLQSQ